MLLMVVGGVSSVGLSNIILVENTVNEFAYAQMLLYFKEDFDNYRKKLMNNYISNRTVQHHVPRNQIKI